MNTKHVLIATLAGMAAGVVFGMLIAPEKGSTLRKNLVQKTDELKDSLVETLSGYGGKLGTKKEAEVPVRKEVQV